VECIIDTLSFDGKYARDRTVIRDNGCGMSPAFLERVFLPFEQERKSQEPGQCGTGLGLTIVKSLVELMGGTITIRSTEGVGTEVTLLFTTELVDMGQVQNSAAPAPAEFDLTGRRVLVCEDHPLNREIAGRLLTRKGLLVDMAENGADGLKRFQDSPWRYYDAVLMDIRMPILDGLRTARAIRRLDRPDAAVPIIAMTANAFQDDIQKSMDAGMNAHLSKPIEPLKLYETLYALLPGGKTPS
jgi:CheY-like chemotaxis protein